MKRNLLKKIGVYVAVLCMLMSLLPVTVLANPEGEASEKKNGAGEKIELELTIPEDAIQISTVEELLAFAENCRVNIWSVGKVVVLANDIDMSDVEFTGIPTFGGTFLGQGHMISGIKMEHEGSVAGFFRYLQKTAIVEGLTIKGSYIFEGSHSTIGGFVGNNAGSIYNCTFEGAVAGAEQIGGFAGINETTGLIENCIVNGTIYGNHFVGGLAGENKGVVRSCTNNAEVNTKSIQNSVDLEDITLDSLINTENAGTTTDIGGIAGGNSGVLRSCVNNGVVGYQKMGYNIGGIAGTQNGFIVDCENYGEVYGRKEVGGIVGQMEPNIIVKYDEDTLQILDGQLDELNTSVDQMQDSVQSNSDDVKNRLHGMGNDVDDANDALDAMLDAINPQNGSVDRDKVTAAAGSMGDSLKSIYNQSTSIYDKVNASSKDAAKQMEGIVAQTDSIRDTMQHAEDNLNVTIKDVSGLDAEEDTLGKVSNCINYGAVSGDLNIGGIAGVLAEENDLEAYQNTEIIGEESLNFTYQLRVVVRNCINHGNVSNNKQYGGGIVGQMLLGAVLESINMGNIDAVSADYIGGIAGASKAIIRNCSVKSIISADDYVGGIVGKGHEVTDCYAFVDMKHFVEKAGAIIGFTDDLPDGNEDIILRNYYFNAGKEAGGIDGIAYTGATDALDVAAFLQLQNLSDLLRTVTLRFVVEGQEDVVLTVNVGESLTMEQIPTIAVDVESEYEWELIPTVTAEVLGMGETATVEYLSEDSITNILFSQTYKVAFDLKDTVISSVQRNDKNMSVALAEGIFAKNTTLEVVELFSSGATITVDEKTINSIVDSKSVTLSNIGVSKLHYLISAELDTEKLVLYVQDASGVWKERAYVVEGSYIVFDFADGETGFALQQTEEGSMLYVIGIAAGILVLALFVGIIMRKKSKKVSA